MNRPLPKLLKLWIGALLTSALCAPCARAQEIFELGAEGFKKVQAPDPASPEGQLHAARRHIADGNAAEAIRVIDAWLLAHKNHKLVPEAYLLRGDAQVSREHYFESLYDYEHLIRTYPGSDQFHTALQREFRIARLFAYGTKRLLWGQRWADAGGEAEELLIRIQERSPGSRLAEQAGIELADYYYRTSDMAMAAEAYDLFLENFPNSQWRQHAMVRQVMANLAIFKGPRFDVTGLIEARRRLLDYQDAYPGDAERIGVNALLNRIDDSLAQRDYGVAEWYERIGQPVSAAYMYKRLLENHPGSSASRRALERLKVLDPGFLQAQGPAPQPESKP